MALRKCLRRRLWFGSWRWKWCHQQTSSFLSKTWCRDQERCLSVSSLLVSSTFCKQAHTRQEPQSQYQLLSVTLPEHWPLYQAKSFRWEWSTPSGAMYPGQVIRSAVALWGHTGLEPHCSPTSLCTWVSHGSNVTDFKPRGLSALIAAQWARWETRRFTQSFSLSWMRPQWTRSQWLNVWRGSLGMMGKGTESFLKGACTFSQKRNNPFCFLWSYDKIITCDHSVLKHHVN